MLFTNQMIEEISKMIQANGGELRVSEVKAKFKFTSKISDLAYELQNADFEVFKKGNAFVVKATELQPEPHVHDPIEVESAVLETLEKDGKPFELLQLCERLADRFNEIEVKAACKALTERGTICKSGKGGWARYAPRGSVLEKRDPVQEILAPLGNLDEKFDTISQMEIGALLEVMRHRLQWRAQDLARKTAIESSVVRDWLSELRQYGIIAVSLNSEGKAPRYVLTRSLERGTCYCSPELHTCLPMIGNAPHWGNRWAQIKTRVRIYEKAVRFATMQEVQFALDWSKADFDATIEHFKQQSLIEVKNNIIRILRKK